MWSKFSSCNIHTALMFLESVFFSPKWKGRNSLDMVRHTFLTADSNMLQKIGNCLKLPVLRVRSSMSTEESNTVSGSFCACDDSKSMINDTYMPDRILPSTDLLSQSPKFQLSANLSPLLSSEQTPHLEIQCPPPPGPPPSLWVCGREITRVDYQLELTKTKQLRYKAR